MTLDEIVRAIKVGAADALFTVTFESSANGWLATLRVERRQAATREFVGTGATRLAAEKMLTDAVAATLSDDRRAAE